MIFPQSSAGERVSAGRYLHYELPATAGRNFVNTGHSLMRLLECLTTLGKRTVLNPRSDKNFALYEGSTVRAAWGWSLESLVWQR